MNYKINYAINTSELFEKFDIKTISTNSNVLKEHYKTKEKKEMAVKVFLYAIYLILLDVIKNNITFVLPTPRRALILMQTVHGDEFIEEYKRGRFKDVDPLLSNLTGHQLEFFYHISKKLERRKNIYVNNELKQMIINNTNNGKKYL